MYKKIAVLSFLALFRSIDRRQPNIAAKGDTSDEQRRAYLTLTDANLAWSDPKPPNGTATIMSEWTNVGRTDATNVGFSYAVEFVPARRGAKPAPNSAFIWQPQRGDVKLEPGDKISAEAGQIPPAMVKKWRAGECTILVYGAVVYTDVMGKENRVETCNRAFLEEVDGELILKFKIAEFNNSSIYGIQSEGFSAPTPPTF